MRVPSIRQSFQNGFRRWIRKTIDRILYGTKYNPERFWFLWGLTYKRVFYKRYRLKGNVKQDNLNSLVKALDKLSFESLLEVGCGYGICLQQIQRAFPSKSIHVCDISWTQLVQARRFL